MSFALSQTRNNQQERSWGLHKRGRTWCPYQRQKWIGYPHWKWHHHDQCRSSLQCVLDRCVLKTYSKEVLS